MAGIDHLLKQSALVDALTDLVKEAKEDDGKLTLSDLLDKDVLLEALDVFEQTKNLIEDHDELLAEVKDLDASEAVQLVVAYIGSFEKLHLALKS